MAVNFHDTPKTFNPSDNPIRWTFSSNQTAQPNFSYLVKVYINNVLIANELIFPENGIYSRFDARDYTSSACQIPTISSDLVIDAANYCLVKITVVERYGATPVDQASAAASNVVAWKARMTDEDFVDWTPADYTFGASGSKWLTNYPTTENAKVRETVENKYLMCITNNVNVDLLITLYDEDDVAITNDTYAWTAAGELIIICNVSPASIIANTGILAGEFAQAEYYTVGDTSDLQFYRIEIDRSCVYSTYRRLHFLGQWGTIESYSFGLISRVSASVKSYGYKKIFGEWDGSSFTFSKEQGTDVDYAKMVDRKMTVESDWLSEDVQNWMVNNMYGSPLVYEQLDSLMIRRKVMNTSFAESIQENDMLFNEQVQLGLKSVESATI